MPDAGASWHGVAGQRGLAASSTAYARAVQMGVRVRDRVVSVRFAPSEHTRLAALRADAPLLDERGRPLRSLAYWCRVALTRAVLSDQMRPGMPTVTGVGVDRIEAACAVLNERAYETNAVRQVVAGSLDALDAVVGAAVELAPAVVETAIATDELRVKLVNVRVSDDDYQLWSLAAREVQFTRVSAWAWDVLVGIAGYVHNRKATVEVATVRRQLAGAINNAAQLQAVAEETNPDVFDAIESRAIELIALMARWNTLGRPR